MNRIILGLLVVVAGLLVAVNVQLAMLPRETATDSFNGTLLMRCIETSTEREADRIVERLDSILDALTPRGLGYVYVPRETSVEVRCE